MKGTVNPFEPWRPVESPIPPPLHAGRPWRPPIPPPKRAAVEEPPLVEPVKPSPRSKPPERPRRPEGQGGQLSAQNKSDPQRRREQNAIVFGILFLFLLPFLVELLKWQGETHFFRVIVTLLAVAVALVGVWRRNWSTSLKWMAVSLALAGLSAWFVPTLRGVNLWSAYRRVEELRSLPAGDVAAYQRGAAARQTLVEEFPSFAADVRAAEQAWLRRTVDEAIENADRQSKNDPHEALAHLRQLGKDLSAELGHNATVKNELESARQRVLQACLKVAQR